MFAYCTAGLIRPSRPERRRRLARALLLAAGLAGALASPVGGAEILLQGQVNNHQRGTLDSVDGSVPSRILRQRAILTATPVLDQTKRLDLRLEREAYALHSDVADDLLLLDIDKAQPRYQHTVAPWDLDVGALAVNFTEGSHLYTAVPEDDTRAFLLPNALGRYAFPAVTLSLALRDEYDLLTLDYNRFTVILLRYAELGAVVPFAETMELGLTLSQVDRFYPSELAQTRTDYTLRYDWHHPLTDPETGHWRLLSAILARKHYAISGDAYNTATLESHHRFRTGGVTHFLTPGLTWMESLTVYRTGSLAESLVEETVDEAGVSGQLAYSAFTRLGESRWFVAWGANWTQTFALAGERQLGAYGRLILTL